MLGSKLMFVDIERDSQRLQIMIEVKKLDNHDDALEAFKAFKRTVARGDWVCK
jgi:lysyl-tRNA synthetase class 2